MAGAVQEASQQMQNTAVAEAALEGLRASPKTLSPWLFYDQRGSQLFEDITRLPEYYLTRTERGILAAHAGEILAQLGSPQMRSPVTIVELGAGSASKTGLLLQAALETQDSVVYQPIDVSASALAEAAASLAEAMPRVQVRPQVANYVTDRYEIERVPGAKVLSLYIGSSIGNFDPREQAGILLNLRERLEPGDALLLGTDLAPGPQKSEATLIAAYDDAAGVTAEFNLNVLDRLKREADARLDRNTFRHRARWNAVDSRMEMHLESTVAQTVEVAGERFTLAAGETIHTENSYKFTAESLGALFAASGFTVERSWQDADARFAVTMAVVA